MKSRGQNMSKELAQLLLADLVMIHCLQKLHKPSVRLRNKYFLDALIAFKCNVHQPLNLGLHVCFALNWK